MNKKYRWLILLIGFLAQVTFSIGFSGIAVSGVIMQDVYRFNVKELGFVLGCMGLGVALSEMIWGILTDKVGDKVVLVWGLVLMGLSYGYMSFKCVPIDGYYPDYKYLGVLLIITGMVGGSINSSSGHAVMNWFDDNMRGFAMSIRQTAIPIGAAIGSIIFPYIALNKGFKSAFFFMSILCLTTILIVIFGLKTKSNNDIIGEKYLGINNSPYKKISIWKIAIAGGILTVPQMAIMSFGAVYLTEKFHFSILSISFIIAFIQLLGGIFRIATGLISDKHKNRKQILRIISITCSCSSILLSLVNESSVYLILCLFTIIGVAGNAWHGVGYTEIAVKSGDLYSGRGLGMMGMVVFTVSFLTPYVIPYILQIYSWKAVWFLIGVTTIMVLPLMNKSGDLNA